MHSYYWFLVSAAPRQEKELRIQGIKIDESIIPPSKQARNLGQELEHASTDHKYIFFSISLFPSEKHWPVEKGTN